MNRLLAVLLVVIAGATVRIVLYRANEDLFAHPQVDELEYLEPLSTPFERPPGTYFAARLPYARVAVSVISLLPSLFFLLALPRTRRNLVLSGLLAVEPTLALSGIQLLPEAPAAALTALCLVLAHSGRNRMAGFVLGAAALFRGELLILLPLLPILGRRGRTMALFALAAVAPVVAVNMASGGPPSVASTGGMNLWIGSDWSLLSTPPGVEFEQLMEVRPGHSFTERAVSIIGEDPAGWALRGMTKSLAFFTLPGPGRNIDSGEALKPLIVLLGVTALFLAGAAGIRRDLASLLMLSGVLSAFLFFPSVRYRVVFLPAFALTAAALPWRRLLFAVPAVLALSLFLQYPGHVRPGLNTLLTAQNALRENDAAGCLALLDEAGQQGFEGADIHNIRASAMAIEGREFRDVLLEFGLALELAPRSPTVWRNMAAFLWNYGRTQHAREAAQTAVRLDPGLEAELSEILSSPTE
ncbi:MAG: hypothetical protein R6V62_05945 [Candidatus Fermentibacteraceae bacterium]